MRTAWLSAALLVLVMGGGAALGQTGSGAIGLTQAPRFGTWG